MTPIAAVDIGSLTVRLAVAEVLGPGRFQVILHHREITGLGREVGESGVLARADQDRTLEALGVFAREMAARGVERGQACGHPGGAPGSERPGFSPGSRGDVEHPAAPPYP